MRRPNAMLAGLVALSLLSSGCYGPFLLTRKVWKFNGEVSDNKWVVEVVYLVCTWLPVYGVAGLADALIFNSVEFWTGKNPMSEANAQGISSKRIVRNNNEMILKREGNSLKVEQLRDGKTSASLQIQRQGDSMVALDENGALLYGAHTRADGSVQITDAKGKQIALYSGEDAKQALKSIKQ